MIDEERIKTIEIHIDNIADAQIDFMESQLNLNKWVLRVQAVMAILLGMIVISLALRIF